MIEGEVSHPTVIAVVVTFNPDLQRLRENLQAAAEQVERVVVVDNASDNALDVRGAVHEVGGVLLLLSENRGISRALNSGIARASRDGAEAVLLLDQDSVCADDMVEALEAGLQDGYDVVAPRIVDRNIPVAPGPADGIEAIEYCITSGSLVRVSTWQSVAGFDQQLFIDFVDFDFCLRVRATGGHIARAHRAILQHEIGQAVRHGRFVAYNHSSFRTRHMAEDMILYARKHRRAARRFRPGGRGILLTYAVLLRKAFIIARFEQDRPRKIAALARGMAVGTVRRFSA